MTTQPQRRLRPSLAFVAAMAALVLRPVGTLAQGTADNDGRRANRLVSDAVRLAAHGDTSAALDRLEEATRLAPNLAEAHYRRGMLLARQSGTGLGDMMKRRAAAAALDRAIRFDQGNPAYFLELGKLKLKQGLQRLDAGRLFNRALKVARERGDPAMIAEVEAELGDIDFRRYLSVGHRRLLTGSGWTFDPNEALSNPHYAKDFLAQQTSEIEDAGELDLRKAEAHYRAGVAASPSHDEANAGLLGVLYDDQRYEEFHEQARAFARAAPKSARAHLFHGLGLWRLGRGREAAAAFQRAMDLLEPAERAALNSLSVILRRSDAEKYDAMSEAQRAEFNRVYWAANDPLKLTPENEHLLEHWARAAYTDMRFSSPELHLRGWDTDRGVIYMRYGPPPVVATFPPETTQQSDDPMSIGVITTVWYYPERNLRFVFYGPPGYNFARFAGEFTAYAEDARYAIPVKYDNVSVTEALDSVALQVAEFRHPTDSSKTELVFFAGLPLARMTSDVDLKDGPIETGLFVTDLLERPVVTDRRNERVQFGAERQFEQRTYTTALTPGQYRYRVEVRQPTTQRAARGAGGLPVESFERPTLTLSDVILADNVAPLTEDAPTGRRDFLLDPNPAMRYAPGDAVHLYWEIYDLTPDSAGQIRYTAEVVLRVQSLERNGIIARAFGPVLDAVGVTAKGDDPVSLRYDVADALAGRDRVPAWVAVRLDQAPSGTYTLELTITDGVSGQVALRRRVFTVTEREP